MAKHYSDLEKEMNKAIDDVSRSENAAEFLEKAHGVINVLSDGYNKLESSKNDLYEKLRKDTNGE